MEAYTHRLFGMYYQLNFKPRGCYSGNVALLFRRLSAKNTLCIVDAQGILINLCTAAAAAASENRTRAAFAHGSDRSVPSGAR